MRVLIKSLYPYLFLSFCFVIPLDKYATAVPNIILVALLVSFPFAVTKQDFAKLLKKEIIIFAGLVTLIAFNTFFYHEMTRDVVVLKKIASSLLLIVLFIPLEKTENLKKTLIVSVLVCIIICLYNLYWFYMEEGVFNFSSGSVINDILIIDRLYLGFLCVISIIASIGLIGEKYNDYNKWYFANIVLCVAFVLLISSRIAILLLIVLFFLKMFYTENRKKYLLFFIGIVGIVLVSFMLNKNLNERFFFTHSTQKGKISYIELASKWEPRVVIWECNYAIFKEDPALLVGNGFYNVKDKLANCYQEKIQQSERRKYFVEQRFNPHNLFVDFIISSGLLAGALFIILLGFMFIRNRTSYFKMAAVLSIIAFAFIESFFHRQIGAYIFAIIIILIIYPKTKEVSKKNETTQA